MATVWAKGDKEFFWKGHIHPDEQENTNKFKSNLCGKRLREKKSVKACLSLSCLGFMIFV